VGPRNRFKLLRYAKYFLKYYQPSDTRTDGRRSRKRAADGGHRQTGRHQPPGAVSAFRHPNRLAGRDNPVCRPAKYVDQLKDIDARLAPSRSATSGPERLDAYIEAWGNYIPEIYGIARVLLALKDAGDEEAAAAWTNRMDAMREGCAAAIDALKADGRLSSDNTRGQATALLWTLLSVRNWEHLRLDCGWSQKAYIAGIKTSANRLFVAPEEGT